MRNNKHEQFEEQGAINMENKELQDLHELGKHIRKWVDSRTSPEELGFYPNNLPKMFETHPCKDHPRFYKGISQPMIYESHPYSASMEELKELINWCEERNLEFRIDGYSPWYPMNTVRITIYEEGKAPSFTEEMK